MSENAKVALEVSKAHRNPFYAERARPLTMALPFFRSGSGSLWHRVRSGSLHYNPDGSYSHTSLHYWCGNVGHMPGRKQRGELSADPGERAVHCSICEGKAVGMARDGSNKILGRTVLFQPRK